jgi:DNA-binding transcriptional MerR regulator
VVSPADAERSNTAGTERSWTVRQLADELGVTTRTLRFYEAEGLIAPMREGTSRRYSVRDRARLRLILRGRRFGMTLAECREIVDIYDGAATSEQRQLQTLLDRLGDIEADLTQRRADLDRIIDEVGTVAATCQQRLDELSRDEVRSDDGS